MICNILYHEVKKGDWPIGSDIGQMGAYKSAGNKAEMMALLVGRGMIEIIEEPPYRGGTKRRYQATPAGRRWLSPPEPVPPLALRSADTSAKRRGRVHHLRLPPHVLRAMWTMAEWRGARSGICGRPIEAGLSGSSPEGVRRSCRGRHARADQLLELAGRVQLLRDSSLLPGVHRHARLALLCPA